MNNPNSQRSQRIARPYAAWRAAIDEICMRHRACRKDVLSGLKSATATLCRYEIWWTLHRVFGASLSAIGRRMGGFHHTTVMHGVRMWELRVKEGVGVNG